MLTAASKLYAIYTKVVPGTELCQLVPFFLHDDHYYYYVFLLFQFKVVQSNFLAPLMSQFCNLYVKLYFKKIATALAVDFD